jgi:RNA 2',3'-cyclic 3'-phosphodiesterase
MRAFLALEPREIDRSELIAWQQSHFGKRKRLRLVPPQQLHLTLRFFGDLAEAVAREFADQANGWVLPNVIDSAVVGLGGFPTARRATVLVAKVLDGQGLMHQLYSRCDAACSELAMPAEQRPFVPHVTLARLTKAFDLSAILSESCELPMIAFDRLTLFRSELSPRGAIHERWASWQFSQPDDSTETFGREALGDASDDQAL